MLTVMVMVMLMENGNLDGNGNSDCNSDGSRELSGAWMWALALKPTLFLSTLMVLEEFCTTASITAVTLCVACCPELHICMLKLILKRSQGLACCLAPIPMSHLVLHLH